MKKLFAALLIVMCLSGCTASQERKLIDNIHTVIDYSSEWYLLDLWLN